MRAPRGMRGKLAVGLLVVWLSVLPVLPQAENTAYRGTLTAVDTVTDAALDAFPLIVPRTDQISLWVNLTLGSATQLVIRPYYRNNTDGGWYRGENPLTLTTSVKQASLISTTGRRRVAFVVESISGAATVTSLQLYWAPVYVAPAFP